MIDDSNLDDEVLTGSFCDAEKAMTRYVEMVSVKTATDLTTEQTMFFRRSSLTLGITDIIGSKVN
jgi:hypothetical protein